RGVHRHVGPQTADVGGPVAHRRHFECRSAGSARRGPRRFCDGHGLGRLDVGSVRRAVGPGQAMTVPRSVASRLLVVGWAGGETMRSFGVATAVLALIVVAGCSATMEPERTLQGSSPSNTLTPPKAVAEGDVVRVDPAQRVIVLSNGQMYQVPANSVVYVNGQPMAWTTVQPGTRIAVPQGQLVELRDGRYMVVQSPGAVATPAPGTVVTPAPGAVVATPGVRQTIYGRVTDVDRNEIRVRTANESFEVKMNDPKGAGIRKGDTVQIDMTFAPTSPSALP